jgi:PhnB protein
MLKSTPFILFDGNCAEAMTFYHECLGGELLITKLGDSPLKEHLPPEKHNRVINANLKRGDLEISATDWMASPQYEPTQGDTYAIFLRSDDLGEMEGVFNKLAVGAREDRFQALHDLPMGKYGQMYDRFGVHWIFLVPT